MMPLSERLQHYLVIACMTAVITLAGVAAWAVILTGPLFMGIVLAVLCLGMIVCLIAVIQLYFKIYHINGKIAELKRQFKERYGLDLP